MSRQRTQAGLTADPGDAAGRETAPAGPGRIAAAPADEESQLRLIAEYATDVIGRFTPDGICLYVSPASRTVYGYAPEEMIGKSAYDLVPGDDDVSAILAARETIEEGATSSTVTHRVLRKDGLYIWVETTLRGLRDPGTGAIDTLVCVTRDVTARRGVEDALRESEERHRLLFDQNPHPAYVFDLETFAFLAVNQAAIETYGYSRDEFFGMRATDLRPPEEVPKFVDAVLSFDPTTTRQGEFRHRKKDGSIMDVEVSGRIIQFGGRPAGLSLVDDITDRKAAEARLRESEEGYRLLFEQNPQPVWVFDRDTFEFLAVNQAALDAYGFSREEFLRMKVTEVRPPDQVAHFIDRTAQVRADLVRQGEFVHQRRDGTRFDVEVFARTIEFAGRPAILALLNDVTERNAAEARLRASEEMSRSLLENAPDLIVTLTPEGIIRSFNRDMVFLDREALVGQSVLQFVPPGMGSEILAAFERVLRTGAREVVEAPGNVAGFTFWYRAHIGPLRKDGRISGLMVIASNVTEEKQVREQLLETYRELEHRSAELSGAVESLRQEIQRRERVERDLRNSRTRLRGLSTRLLSAQEEERRRISREVHDELGQALTAMRMELAAIRRDQAAGREDPAARIEMVDALIDDAIHTVRRIAIDLRPGALDDLGLEAALDGLLEEFRRRSGVEFSLTIEPEELELDSLHSTTIFRVVQEALTNVARHANATRVSVSLRKTAERVSLRVRDDGRGITRGEVSGASSLGLVGIRERARLCGGTVSVSGAPDRGTELRLQIPLRGDGAAAKRSAGRPPNGG